MGKLKLPTSLLGTLKVQSIAMFKNSLISLFLIAFLGASVQGQAPGDPPLSNPCVVPWYGLLASAPVYYSPSDQQDIGIVLWVTCDRPNTFGYTQLLSGGQVLGNCSSFTFDSHLTSNKAQQLSSCPGFPRGSLPVGVYSLQVVYANPPFIIYPHAFTVVHTQQTKTVSSATYTPSGSKLHSTNSMDQRR
jgi:hypothetical protein